jgi:hypothetical protein
MLEIAQDTGTQSTDAGDLYDGFGAAELTIGIRAYQWG